MAAALGVNPGWITKFYDGTLKTLSDKHVDTIEKSLGVKFQRIVSAREGAPGTLSTTFKRIMKSAGVPDKVTLPGGIVASRSFHSLRHSFTSWLANAEIPSDVRQRLTGHLSTGIHARYTHHDDALDRAIESLPDLSSPSKNPPSSSMTG